MGCAWRWLPHDYPAWQTVYHYFRTWRKDGTWERIHNQLYHWVRVSEGRSPTASAAILDSQSVETATMVAKKVGFDAGKLVKGRKRHLLVDTLGLKSNGGGNCCCVSPIGMGRVLSMPSLDRQRERFPRLVRIWVDGGYRGENFMRACDGYLSLDS